MSASIKEVNEKFKNGCYEDAWSLATSDWQANPNDIWEQRKMGWAVFYMLKRDADLQNFDLYLEHLGIFQSLELLSATTDNMIMSNLPWAIAEFSFTDEQCDEVLEAIKPISFPSSNGYSRLLNVFLKHKNWPGLGAFIEWWDLSKLTSDDYRPFETKNGRQIMSLAEQAYIAYARCLLQSRDVEKMRDFIPKLESLGDKYPDMNYPGYFVGKLLLASGAEEERLLEEIIPFVRRKSKEFWTWQLLSEVYELEDEACLACLLRAVHCSTKEEFLGNVRTTLMKVYLSRGDYARAKYNLEIVVKKYLSLGWKIPYTLQNVLHEPWVETVQPDASDPIDYLTITNDIFLNDLPEHLAVVVNVNMERKNVQLVYGVKKRANVKLNRIGFKTKQGDVLSIRFDKVDDGKMNLLSARKVKENNGLSFYKKVVGNVVIREGNAFGFVNDMFISPMLVSYYKLCDGKEIEAMAVYDFNPKKSNWNWVVINILSK